MTKLTFNCPIDLSGPVREFHITRRARERYDLDASLFSLRGNLILADFDAAQQLAFRINRVRDASRYPEQAVKPGDLYAAGLLHEILHLVLTMYRERAGGDLPERLMDALRGSVGEGGLERSLEAFVAAFPPSAVYRNEQTPEAYLAGQTGGVPHRYVVAEEMLMLWLSNENPAYSRLADLIDDAELREGTAYLKIIRGFEKVFDEGLPFGPAGDSLFELLRAPVRHSPTSLEGQLRYVRERWAPFLGERFGALMGRILTTLDVLKEEQKGGGPGGPGPAHVLDRAALRGEGMYRATGPVEYERFSSDASWMPRVVLLAKSSYVWLDQLSKQYRRNIHRLDQIPDEELDELARRGFTGLWLIGLWERSEASRRIKHIRGQPDAVASAYALYDYVIAADLGGEAAYENLRDRAHQRGIRLASDMVPNHVGMDGRWVLEHPDWFIELDHSPYPGYSFNGPDLSDDERVGIFLEDHYYDSSDAAVVFRRLDRHSGQERYIYHGNDGTSMPWNDTAQLDYLKPEVREAVIETILQVARRFPIIRFDAAMVLAKQHIQRLWYPEPGHGGAIPSRAQYGSMSTEEFDRRIPNEFWREVVDRVAEEVPDTLLLAEAFWMMEGYFVRTLGMHRVYNSAFMNMLKREENAQYRQLVKNVLEFEPEVLKRFVNFMNNPDEETAEAQFGRDDKYFGVATLMATMPGLPMFGHGQVEGYTEKYGMEYRRPKRDEQPDAWLVERHRREIFPLLHRRAQFAEVENFLFYDLYTPEGQVNEDVYVYSNLVGDHASLVVFNNKFAEAKGWIRAAVPYSVKTGQGDERQTVQKSLGDGLNLRANEEDFLVFKEHVSGLEHLRRSRDLAQEGFYVDLGAFKHQVFLDFREVEDNEYRHFAQLEGQLAGRGVPSVAAAVEELRLRPLHEALARVLQPEHIQALSGGASRVDSARLVESYRDFLEMVGRYGGGEPQEAQVSAFEQAAEALQGFDPAGMLSEREAGEATRRLEPSPADTALLLDWAALHDIRGPEAGEAPDALFERWRFARPLREALSGLELGDEATGERVRLFKLLLRYQDWPQLVEKTELPVHQALLKGLFQDDDVLHFLRVHNYEGVRWFHREAYRALVEGLVGLALFRSELGEPVDVKRVVATAQGLAQAEKASGYRFDALLPKSVAQASVEVGSASEGGKGKAPEREGEETSSSFSES